MTLIVRRRHLAYLPKVAATIALVLCAGFLTRLVLVAVVAGAYVGTAMLLAIGDHVVTVVVPWVRRSQQDRVLERSIRLHPSNVPFKRQGAVA